MNKIRHGDAVKIKDFFKSLENKQSRDGQMCHQIITAIFNTIRLCNRDKIDLTKIKTGKQMFKNKEVWSHASWMAIMCLEEIGKIKEFRNG